jgi:LppP/LprE lipoprotein
MLCTVRRVGICGCLVALLLLGAACGDQPSGTGRGAAKRSAAASNQPGSSAQPAAPNSSPGVHPPVLPAPASSFGPYSTAQAAERFVGANGLSAQAPEATWRQSAVLHVIHANSTSAADSPGDWYFFFVDGKFVGQRYFTRASSSDALDEATFAVTYAVFRPDDAHCCPSGGTATVRFRWQAGHLTALDPMPGPIQS